MAQYGQNKKKKIFFNLKNKIKNPKLPAKFFRKKFWSQEFS